MSGDHKTMALAAWHYLVQRIDHADRERGASMVEYALLLVLVLLVSFFTIAVFGETLVGVFEAGSNTLDSAPGAGTGSGSGSGTN